ncbi:MULTISPECIES: hypothetical protein [Synergistales]|uniref:hypothetical protein n=1 Tax=Synergistales TaxID=649776 RepID=UPI0023687F5E|nr:hypothetical protein [Aminithiophilus ramosus]
MTAVHAYRCASCGKVFRSERLSSTCPFCRGKVLIHLEGEARRPKSCGGSCSGCSGCGGGGR